MLEKVAEKHFANGSVYALRTSDGYLIETTDTFLPFYTKDAINRKQNFLDNADLGSRAERWMIGVSVMSGCPCRCKFCATGNMRKYRNLTAEEIVEQVEFVLNLNSQNPLKSKEFKINYTRMGEPFLNIDNVKAAIEKLDKYKPHHYVSTIGIKNSDFSWIKENISLQVSLHSLDENRRNDLIPFKNKMSIIELGAITTSSKLKTTLNMTLVDERDFDIKKLKQCFAPEKFFVKLSPINENTVSKKNELGKGIISGINVR